VTVGVRRHEIGPAIAVQVGDRDRLRVPGAVVRAENVVDARSLQGAVACVQKHGDPAVVRRRDVELAVAVQVPECHRDRAKRVVVPCDLQGAVARVEEHR